MTEEELLNLPTVGPEEAARFLGNNMSTQYVRLWCQDGDCPFGTAKRLSPRRYNYTINRQLLIKYRRGEIPLHVPAAVVQLLAALQDRPM